MLAGLPDPDGADGLKACRRGADDVHRIVVKEQHSLGGNPQPGRDLRPGRLPAA